MSKRAHTSFCDSGGNCWCKSENATSIDPVIKPRITQAALPKPSISEATLPPVEFSIGDKVRLVEKYAKRCVAELGEHGIIRALMPGGERALVLFPESNVEPDVPFDCLKRL